MYSEILILAMLQQGSRHGYEIKKDLDRALGGMVTLNNKTLYLALKHFEEMGAEIFHQSKLAIMPSFLPVSLSSTC